MAFFKTLFPFSNELVSRARPDVSAPAIYPTTGGAPMPLLGPLTNYLPLQATEYVTEATVLGLPAANRALHLISNATAQMLTHGKTYQNNSEVETKPLIVSRPNVMYGSYEFWFEAVATAVMHGNYVALVAEVDADGYALQLAPIHPALVDMKIENGFPIYQIGEDKYSWRQVVHVRGLTLPGSRWGIGVIESHRRALGGISAEQTYSISSLEKGGVPTYVVKLDSPQPPTQDALDEFGTAWRNIYTKGAREVAILPKGIDIEAVSWTPQDMEFLESRKFSVAEIALMFNLDPTDLSASVGAVGSLTYSNNQSRELTRLLHTYAPWLHRFEDAWSDLLPEGWHFEGNADSILRMVTKERYESYALAIAGGWMTPEDVIKLEGR